MYNGTLWHTGVTIFTVEMQQCINVVEKIY